MRICFWGSPKTKTLHALQWNAARRCCFVRISMISTLFQAPSKTISTKHLAAGAFNICENCHPSTPKWQGLGLEDWLSRTPGTGISSFPDLRAVNASHWDHWDSWLQSRNIYKTTIHLDHLDHYQAKLSPIVGCMMLIGKSVSRTYLSITTTKETWEISGIASLDRLLMIRTHERWVEFANVRLGQSVSTSEIHKTAGST